MLRKEGEEVKEWSRCWRKRRGSKMLGKEERRGGERMEK